MELHLNLKGLWKWGDWWHAILMIHLCFTESKSSTINTLLHLISLFQVSWFMFILWNQFNTRSVLVVDLNQNIKMNRFQCTSNKLKIDHNFGFMLKIQLLHILMQLFVQFKSWKWNKITEEDPKNLIWRTMVLKLKQFKNDLWEIIWTRKIPVKIYDRSRWGHW